jgi:hypothetical protein
MDSMAIRAVVFDIGGVLEITPNLGISRPACARVTAPGS